MRELFYHLNSRDEIASVSEEWHRFALANDGESLLESAILGRPLWDFISDIETPQIYRLLHARVRTIGAPVRLTFRCDAPERRRLLQLDISPAPAGGLTYHVRTLQEQGRQPVPQLEPHRPRSESFVTICGWCNRVDAPPRGWLEIEEAVAALALFSEPLPPQLTHGVCEECREIILGALGEERVDARVRGL